MTTPPMTKAHLGPDTDDSESCDMGAGIPPGLRILYQVFSEGCLDELAAIISAADDLDDHEIAATRTFGLKAGPAT
jgi:hypothetical protein